MALHRSYLAGLGDRQAHDVYSILSTCVQTTKQTIQTIQRRKKASVKEVGANLGKSWQFGASTSRSAQQDKLD
eukprot:237945-Amorphochlora_amoeboformis.AAC.1